MKRFLLLGFLLLSFGQMPASAQQYEDDIYYNSKDAKKDAEKTKSKKTSRSETRDNSDDNSQTYNSSGDDGTVYEDDDRSASRNNYDIDDEDYGYSARINRFSYPSYRIGYYSPWYDPFYDPWYSPFWGPSPGLSVSIGYGWGWGGSYFGWGYPAGYYSPWGWGGYGGWGRPWGYGGYGWGGGGYYNGFYDGYYAGGGGYGGGGGYRRTVNYGPRTSMNMPRTSGAYRSGNYNGGTSGPRSGRGQLKPEPGFDNRGNNNNISTRPSRRLPDQGIGSQNGSQERPAPSTSERPSRFRIFGNGGSNRSTNDDAQQAPSYERRSRQSNSTPSYERSAPSYERAAPSRSSSPSRSSGGFSPRGGGSSGGGRRSR